MDMDFESLKNALQLFKESIGLVKTIKDALPDSPKKEAASKSLIAAQTAAEIAEANMAKALGFPLCQCSFPPGIMTLVSAGGHQDLYKCPKCEKDYLVKGKRTGNQIIVNAR
ncbi:MAG: hypothetical protein ACREXW_14715 [Gammaproteobacteria bacterium]